MAQIMLLLNGIVLSGLIYVVLGFYINDILKDDYQRLLTDTQQAISENLTDLDRSIRTISTILDLSGGADEGEIKNHIAYASGRLNRFDHILWIRKNAEGVWQASDITSASGIGQENAFQPFEADYDFIKYILGLGMREKEGRTTIAEIPGANYDIKYTNPVIKERPLLMMRKAGSDKSSMVVGITRISSVITGNWIYNRPGISRIVVQDSKTGNRLYYMDRKAADAVDEENAALPATSYSFDIGDDTWLLAVDAGKDMRTLFLEKTPSAIFLFGLFLTFAGAMYVHGMRRQAGRISDVRRSLSRKTQELNNEIAERERLDKALYKAEHEYKAIVDAVSDIIFEVSPDGEIMFLNSAWKEVTGFDPDQTLGRKIFDLIHPQEQEEHRRNFTQMIEGRTGSYRMLTQLMTFQGKFRTVDFSASMMWRNDNRGRRIIGAITDMEERRQAEKALGEAEKKYRVIVENAVSGIYQITPEGKILSANPAMARMFGYDSPEQMLRELKNAHDLYKDRLDHARFARTLETEGIVKNFESSIETADGRKIWINENARVVRDDRGKILYFEGSIEDITKRKEAEIELRKAKVESDLASRAKSEFLANMSHELRTPLNAIIGFSEIIKNEVLGPLGNRQYWEYARDIHGSGVKLLSVINEILDVSRIEAGERQLNEGVINMGDAVKFCLDFLWQKAEAAHLTIVNRIDDKAPKIIGEERAIKQILLNILSNAIKFTPDAGHITLSYEIDGEGHFRLTVSDTGVGMDEGEMKKALSPFGQVQSAFNRSGSGAGLGLTLVESLMDLHGGRMEMFSQKGVGTAVSIIFPPRRVAQESGESSGGRKSETGSTAGSRSLQ